MWVKIKARLNEEITELSEFTNALKIELNAKPKSAFIAFKWLCHGLKFQKSHFNFYLIMYLAQITAVSMAALMLSPG